jgi:glycine cleavage system H lipoate-binding protein
MTQRQARWPQAASTRCPFLVEESAQFCRLASPSTLVPSRDIATQNQCCSTDGWRSCAWAALPDGDRLAIAATRSLDRSAERCPYLHEIRACSCAASPSSKLIPRTRLAVRRCLGDSHRYCEFFLEQAHPDAARDAATRPAAPDRPTSRAAIPVASNVALAPNHMWLDVGPDGTCHVGVDAFLVRVLGPIEDVAFLSRHGAGSPSVGLTVAGTALPLVFPGRMEITGVNGGLRRHLDQLNADPYGRGWLVEGRMPELRDRTGVECGMPGLRRGAEAEAWMASEVKRLVRHVHTILERRGSGLGTVLGDGGEATASLSRYLERAELLEVFSLFFVRAPA